MTKKGNINIYTYIYGIYIYILLLCARYADCCEALCEFRFCKMSRTERGHLHQVCFTHTHNHTPSHTHTHAEHTHLKWPGVPVGGEGARQLNRGRGTESVFITFTCKICCMFVAAMFAVPPSPLPIAVCNGNAARCIGLAAHTTNTIDNGQ